MNMPKYLMSKDGRVFDVFGYEIEYWNQYPDVHVFKCYAMDGYGCDLFKHVTNLPIPEIKKVHFNDPATVVIWADGTKTVVKCGEEDIYDPQTGLLMCIAKKAFGNNGKFNDILREWIPEEVNAVDAAVNAFEAFANLMHATLVKKEDI